MAEEASRAYPSDLEVLLSVGRMLLAHGQLQMAKRHLLGAAKLSAEPRAPRLLGEVLLRQGDAKRAVRALQRAIQLGATDEETHGWYETAAAYEAVQAEQGREAVARIIDEGFQSQDDVDHIADEDSEDDAPTMIASAQQEAVMAMVQDAQPTRQHSKRARPERPAVPRDDEATDFVQLTQIAQDGAPTRVAAEVPQAIANAKLGAVPPPMPQSPLPQQMRAPATTPLAAAPAALSNEIEDEATAIMSEVDIAQLNKLEARRSGAIKDENTDRVDPPPAKPAEPKKKAPEEAPRAEVKKKAIVDEESDAAWQAAVKKGPTDDVAASSSRAPSVRSTPSRIKKKSSRTGAYVGGAVAAITLTLFAGVRTGRLPEIAQHLPPWLSGAQPTAVDAAPATVEAPPPPGDTATPDPGDKHAKNDPPPATNEPPAGEETQPASEPDPEPVASSNAAGSPNTAEPNTAEPNTAEPKPRPVVYPQPPRPQPAKPETKPQPPPPPTPTPPSKPAPGAPDEPLWLGDPERG